MVEPIRGALAFTFIAASSVLWCTLIFCLGLVRPFFPKGRRIPLGTAMMHMMAGWVRCAAWMLRGLRITHLHETNNEQAASLRPDGWYLVVSNHQTWADILVLVVALYGRIPQFKFFTKRELIWVPFIGPAMWFLEFPYVRRYSREEIEANPALREHDRQATQKACVGFRQRPTSVLVFLEGTRFTVAKRDAQGSRYQRLLNPRTGGFSIVLENLADRLEAVVDVTVRYPNGAPGFWGFLCGRSPDVAIDIRALPLPEVERDAINAWVDRLWEEKDARLRP
ncbi:MAG: acetyltransferase [Gammaproteobacteria bacterium]|nr:acetyltransferase [Gammaproteobacteria bacterium]